MILQVCRVLKLAGVSLLVATTIFFYKVEKLSGVGKHFFFAYSVLVCPHSPAFHQPSQNHYLLLDFFFSLRSVQSTVCDEILHAGKEKRHNIYAWLYG